ncbi:MAG: S8 family serine peptidase [Promethearchaeota archaeon]
MEQKIFSRIQKSLIDKRKYRERKKNVKYIVILVLLFLSFNSTIFNLLRLNNLNQAYFDEKSLINTRKSYIGNIFDNGNDNYVIKSTQTKMTSRIDLNYYLKFRKYDFSLLKELKKYDSIKNLDPNRRINLIILFSSNIDKANMLNIMNKLGWNNNIKRIFNVIPGIAFNAEFSELKSKYNLIEQENEIIKIYKDEVRNIYEYFEYAKASSISLNNWWLEQIGANNLPYNGSGIKIAILDTGISQTHYDLAGKEPSIQHINFVTEEGIRNPDNYIDLNGHGTHVASIAAGTGQSSNGKYRGVAPGATLYNVKIANVSGSIETSDVIAATEWCIENGVDIMSMSFGSIYDDAFNPETLAMTNATQHGIITIASAGNSGPYFLTSGSPAVGISTISVGATNQYRNISSFSSAGPNNLYHVIPDVLAPGSDIIAAEQVNSLLSNYMRYTNSYIEGNYLFSDYIPLSGTSMSCPMVAGAAAILLDAYPNLTPEGVRIALYHGAYKPEDILEPNDMGDNRVGAGIINVSASLEWLANQVDPYELIGVFPKNIPYAPYDLLAYPGDEQYFNISIFSSKNSSQNIQIDLPNLDGIELEATPSTLNFSNHSAEFFQLRVKILENASIGEKTGIIYINKTGSNQIFDTINITINVRFPRGRILFDNFHGLNDWFPAWPSGLNQLDAYQAMKNLHDLGFKLDYYMKYWSYDYDPYKDAQLLTADRLNLADIVVLQTPILPYTPMEINNLKEFIDMGGSIIILGTRSQAICLDSINDLLTSLQTSISINNNNVFDKEDIGVGLIVNDYLVTNVSDSTPIFENGDRFKFIFGPTLTINSSKNTIPLASIDNKLIWALYNGSSLNRGNVAVISDYHFVYTDIYTGSEAEYHQKILKNLFYSLNSKNKGNYSIYANFNATTITNSNQIEMYLSILNISSNNGINSLIPGITINSTIIYPDSTKKQINLTNIGNGSYSNTSILLPVSDYKPYSIQVNISTPMGITSKIYKIFRISTSDFVEISDPTVDKEEIDRKPGNSVNIQYTGNKISLTSNLYGCLTPSTIFNTKNSKEFVFSMSNLLTIYSTDFVINDNVSNSGYFVFYPMANNSGYFNFKADRYFFTIKNYAPEIDKINSYINSISFNDTQDDNYIYGVLVTIDTPIIISLKSFEIKSFEDPNSTFNAIVTYIGGVSASGTIMPMYPDFIPVSVLTFNSDSNNYIGQFIVPKYLQYSGVFGSLNKSQETNQNEPYYSILWLTVRDPEGGTNDFIFLLIVSSTIDITDYLPIIIALGIIGLVILLLYMRSKRQEKFESDEFTTSYEYNDDQFSSNEDLNDQKSDFFDNNHPAYKNCIHCGQKIDYDAIFCPYCGRPQN